MIHVSFPAPFHLGFPLKARIDRCSGGDWWYAGRVGEVISIERETSDGYWAREGGTYNAINIIRKGDVTLLPRDN
jgi:hypothetical protein